MNTPAFDHPNHGPTLATSCTRRFGAPPEIYIYKYTKILVYEYSYIDISIYTHIISYIYMCIYTIIYIYVCFFETIQRYQLSYHLLFEWHRPSSKASFDHVEQWLGQVQQHHEPLGRSRFRVNPSCVLDKRHKYDSFFLIAIFKYLRFDQIIGLFIYQRVGSHQQIWRFQQSTDH